MSARWPFLLLAFLSLGLSAAPAPVHAQTTPLACDVDRDGDIDRSDITLITNARGQTATGSTDPRDPDRDNVITVTDARICTLRCTLAACAIPASNRPPVANAGPDQSVFTGASVQLNGSGSSDPDGDALTYSWILRVRPAGSAAALQNATTVLPSLLVDIAGRYEVDLTVNDGRGGSHTDTVVVTTAPGNTPPVANAGPDQNTFTGSLVTLNGSGSTDIDGDTLSFSWQFTVRPAGSNATLASAGTAMPTFTPDVVGTYTVRLTVNDGRTGTSTDTVNINTALANRPPVANAGPDQLVNAGQAVLLNGTASSDPDGTPITYLWSFASRPAGSTATLTGATSATPGFTADRVGNYVVQLIVNDGQLPSAPDTVLVTSNNVPPVANAGPDQIVTEGAVVSLNGSASSDANGDPLSFFWSLTTVPPASTTLLNNADQAIASFNADVPGLFVAQLIVNDGTVDSAPDTTTITVEVRANRDPVANPDAASTPAGQAVDIAVLANDSDPDSDTLSVSAVTQPAVGGTVSVLAGGSGVRFTPAAGFSGQTTFTYTVSDGRGGTAVGNVTVTVGSLPLVTVAASDAAAAEAGANTGTFTISRTGATTSALAVTYSVNGTATSGADYTAIGTSISIPAGSASVTVTVTPLADNLVEGNETVVLSLVDGAVYDLGGAANATVTIADDPASVTVVATDASAAETGPNTGTFTFTRAGGNVAAALSVQYTASGTATQGTDYAALSAVQFAAGAATATLVVTPNADSAVEGNETAVVTVISTANYLAGTPASATVTIADTSNRPPVANPDSSATQSGVAVTIDVLANDTDPDTDPLTVSAVTQPANGGTVAIGAGAANVIFTPTAGFSGTATFSYTASDGRGGTATATVTVTVSALPTLSISDVSVTEGNTGNVNAVLTVTLSAASSQTVTVAYSTAAGTATAGADYVSASGTLTFAPGVTSQSITLSIVGETLFETNENFVVNLATPVNATIADGQGAVTITNDDATPSLAISDVSVSEGNAGNTNAVLNVTLTNPSSQTITVAWATANNTATAPADYVSASGTLTFAPGVLTQSITLQVVGETLSEPNENFFVNLSAPVNATIADGQGVVTIVNDEAAPTISINDVSITEGNAGNVSAVLTVTLSNSSSQTVTVAYATGIGSATSPADYAGASGTVTFAPGVTTQSITVLVAGDTVFETNEDFFVNLSTPVNATIADSQGVVTIVNDDTVPAISIADVTVTEGNSGTVNAVFTATLTNASSQTVTVAYATANNTATAPTDYVAASSTLTFAPGATTQTLSIVVNGDTTAEANETFFVDLSAPSNATVSTARATGTIQNDDQAALTLTPANQTLLTGASGSLTVTLPSAAPAGGQVVNLVSGTPGVATVVATVTVAAGATTALATVTAGNTAGTTQITASASGFTSGSANVNVTARTLTVSLNSPLVGIGRTVSGTVTLTQPAPTGGVTITLNSSAPGVATVAPASVTIPEGGTTGTLTVTGVSLGSAVISGSAPGFTTATTGITVTAQAINIGTVPVIGPGQSASLPISLSSPAVGNVVINLVSANPGVATVTSTVTIPNGQQVPATNAQVTGVTLGTTSVTASATNFAPETRAVSVTLSFSFAATPNPFAVPLASTQSISLTLSAPAQAGGFVVSLTSDNPAIATVPANITVPAGLTAVLVPVTGVAGGGTTIRANAPGLVEATKTVQVNALGDLQWSPTSVLVGDELQTNVSVRLQNAPPAPVNLTLTAPPGVLLSTGSNIAGSATITLSNIPDANFRTVYVQGTTLGTFNVTASAPGYGDGTLSVQITPAGFAFNGVSTDPVAVNGVSANFQVYSIRLNGDGSFSGIFQQPRGGTTVSVPVVSSNPAAGNFSTSPLVISGGSTSVTATFNPVSTGTTVVSITQPAGFTATSTATSNARAQFTVNTTSSSVEFSSSSFLVGDELQSNSSVRLQSIPASPVNLTLSVPAGSGVLLSSAANIVGSETLVFPNLADAAFHTIYLHGTALGTVNVTASATGYGNATLPVQVTPSGFAFYSISTDTITVEGVATSLQVRSIRLNGDGTFSNDFQNTRAGTSFSVPVISSNPAAGTIAISPLVFAGNIAGLNTTITPVSTGTTTVSVTQPAGFTATSTANLNARTQVTANIIASTTQFAATNLSVGDELQTSTQVRLQSVPSSPVNLTLSVPAGSGLLLSADPAAVGSTTLVLPNVPDAAFRNFYVQGTAVGTVTVTASAPGYGNSTMPVTITPSGFAFFAVATDPAQTDVFAPNVNYQVWSVRLNTDGTFSSSWQPTRGGVTVQVPVSSSNTAVGTITNSPLTFAGNVSSVNATFDPASIGSTLISIAQPAGFTATSTASGNARTQFTTNVIGSVIVFGSANVLVGDELQLATSVRLQSPPPGPITLTLTAGPGVLLSTDPAIAGSPTLVIPNLGDSSNRTIYVQGTSIGSTTVVASAPGYGDATLPVQITPASFAFFSANDPTNVDGTSTNLQVWSVRLNSDGTFSGSWQNTRGGSSASVQVVSSNPSVGTITNSPLVFGGNVASISTTLIPVSTGTTLVSLIQPAGFTPTITATTSARNQFTANVTNALPAVTLTVPDATATEAGQTTGAFTLTRTGGNQAAALLVRVAVGGTAVVSSDYTQFGSNTGGGIYNLTIPAGQTSLTTILTPALDNLVEGAESVTLTVDPSTTSAYVIGVPNSGTITIADDPPVLTLSVTDAAATEAGQTTGAFVLARTGGAQAAALQVRVAVGGTATVANDFTQLGSNTGGGVYIFTIPAGQASLTSTLIPTLDNLAEGAETVTLAIDPSTTSNYNIGTPNSGTITITDDPPTVTLNVTDATMTEAGQTTGTFVLGRTGGNPAASLQVRVLVGGTALVSTDVFLTGASNTGGGVYIYTIPANQGSLTVNLVPNLDNLAEGDETMTFAVDPSTTANYVIGTPNSGTVTIADDPPVITLTVTDATATEAGQTTGAFVLGRTGGNVAANLQVRVAVSGTASVGTDFTQLGSNTGGGIYVFTMPPNQPSVTQTLTPANDTTVEAPETAIFTLSPSTDTVPLYVIGTPNSGTITITSDE